MEGEGEGEMSYAVLTTSKTAKHRTQAFIHTGVENVNDEH
jgi:hypothetical protein